MKGLVRFLIAAGMWIAYAFTKDWIIVLSWMILTYIGNERTSIFVADLHFLVRWIRYIINS